MKKYKSIIHLFAVFFVLLFVIKINNNLFYLSEFEFGIDMMQVTKTSDPLYKEIEEKSSSYNESPQDAIIDRVWKKTPGRNGLKVNIKKSYKNMKKDNAFNEDLLIVDEVKPTISLKDLPASPIYRGHPDKDMVALLINVSWGEDYIPDILHTLKEHKIKATFFIEGQWAKNNAELVKMIDEQGHLIGNHAYNHPDMATLTREKNESQIKQTNDIIKAIIGYTPQWFAPPSGSFNQSVVEIAHQIEMETIMWTVDTVDWKKPSVSVMIKRVMDNIHPGAMILMHPTEPIRNGLDELLSEIKQLELRIDTVEKLLNETR